MGKLWVWLELGVSGSWGYVVKSALGLWLNCALLSTHCCEGEVGARSCTWRQEGSVCLEGMRCAQHTIAERWQGFTVSPVCPKEVAGDRSRVPLVQKPPVCSVFLCTLLWAHFPATARGHHRGCKCWGLGLGCFSSSSVCACLWTGCAAHRASPCSSTCLMKYFHWCQVLLC